jgi:hypothetical protein
MGKQLPKQYERDQSKQDGNILFVCHCNTDMHCTTSNLITTTCIYIEI